MLIKTSELSGVALDWVVAKCEGHQLIKPFLWPLAIVDEQYDPPETLWLPTCDWSQGGLIIEREKICLDEYNGWCAEIKGAPFHQTVVARETGKTPLIAAMRCYVASKLGETVDVPDEVFK